MTKQRFVIEITIALLLLLTLTLIVFSPDVSTGMEVEHAPVFQEDTGIAAEQTNEQIPPSALQDTLLTEAIPDPVPVEDATASAAEPAANSEINPAVTPDSGAAKTETANSNGNAAKTAAANSNNGAAAPPPAPTVPPQTTPRAEPPKPAANSYTAQYTAAKAELFEDRQQFTQATTNTGAAQYREAYQGAMAAMQELCSQSAEVKARYNTECGALPAALGITLQEMYGTLADHTQGTEAVQASITGNSLQIDVYVNFTGNFSKALGRSTQAELAKQGLALWRGEYAGNQYDYQPNMAFDCHVTIHDTYRGENQKAGQNYIDFYCVDGSDYSFTNFGVGYYDRALLGTGKGAIPYTQYTNAAVIMYGSLNGRTYDANEYAHVSAHEFGHVLGLGDQYGKGLKTTPEVPSGKWYVSGDMMNCNGEATPNDVEMFLAAYKADAYQAFLNHNTEVKSNAIKSY